MSGNVGPYPPVKGRCPECGSKSLFLGEGGYVTCSVLSCKNPALASDILMQADCYARLAVAAHHFAILDGIEWPGKKRTR